MLLKLIDAPDFFTRLVPYYDFRPFPLYCERRGWEALSAERRDHLISQAEKAAETPWPHLPATLYMEYARNGNRQNYETLYFQRRNLVFDLLLGECCEGKGRFMEPLIDGVWSICEESSWLPPAHYNRGNCRPEKFNNLPRVGEYNYFDLFGAATGALMALVHYLMGVELGQVSRSIPERIQYEVRHRILEPFMKDDKAWWMGFGKHRRLNNWTPWISSNVASAFLLSDIPEEERAAGLRKAAHCTQLFLNDYAPDGGCEEGPSYFSHAGGALLDLLEMLDKGVHGKTELYDAEKIRNVARYIFHMHVAGPHFVSFSDASPRMEGSIPASTLAQAARQMGDALMLDFVQQGQKEGYAREPEACISCFNPWRSIRGLFEPESKPSAAASPASTFHWYQGIQVCVARESQRSDEGFFLACKGGSNGEAHNHLDVGNFVVYHKGEPLIIDVGKETYNRKTFSPQRYELWHTQSGYHNLPRIAGCEQPNGGTYRAQCQHCEDHGDRVTVSMQLCSAYPWQAGVTDFLRQLTLDRTAHTVTLQDTIDLESAGDVELSLMLAEKPDVTEHGVMTGAAILCMDGMTVIGVDEIPVKDPEMHQGWQRDTLYRLRLISQGKQHHDMKLTVKEA